MLLWKNQYGTFISVDYDALALTPTVDSPPDFDQTRFSVDEDFILDAAKQLVDGLRKVSNQQSSLRVLFTHCIC